jgi:hypothetical protein
MAKGEMGMGGRGRLQTADLGRGCQLAVYYENSEFRVSDECFNLFNLSD